MVFYFWSVCVCVFVCVCLCVYVQKMMRKNRLHLWWLGLRSNTARETFLATGISGWPLEVMEPMLSCVVLALTLQHPQTSSIFTLPSAKSLYTMPSLSRILLEEKRKRHCNHLFSWVQVGRIPYSQKQSCRAEEENSIVVHSLSCIRLFVTPCTAACQAALSFTISQSLLKLNKHVHWISDAIQPSHPLSPPSPPVLNLSQHQGFFQWVDCSHQVAKVFLPMNIQGLFLLGFQVRSPWKIP